MLNKFLKHALYAAAAIVVAHQSDFGAYLQTALAAGIAGLINAAEHYLTTGGK